MSINTSYESYTFRQIGGYAHGTFKDVTSQQASMIESNSKVKAVRSGASLPGSSRMAGFAKIPAEISYMDDNNAKWSYIRPQQRTYARGGRRDHHGYCCTGCSWR